MAYQVALTQVAFNRYYENAIRFDTRAQQETFFRVDDLFANAPTVNLLKGNFFNLEIPWKVSGDDLREMESYNYCIIKETISNNTKYYYYFITNMRYDQSNQFILSLELDIINTYYIDAIFSDGLINRAHLNRWSPPYQENNVWKVKFDNSSLSPMLIPDINQDLSKYPVSRTECKMSIFSGSEQFDAINDWINDNIECWEYIFLTRSSAIIGDDGFTFNFKSMESTEQDVVSGLYPPIYLLDTNEQTTGFNNYYTYICLPIYKSNHNMYFSYFNRNYYIGSAGTSIAESKFRDLNNDASYYIAKILSKIPPFFTLSNPQLQGVSIDSNGNLYLGEGSGLTGPYGHCTVGWISEAYHVGDHICVLAPSGAYASGQRLYYKMKTTYEFKPISIPFSTEFAVSDIVDSDYSSIYNPKLLSSNYTNLKIINDNGDSFNYDLQKINRKDIPLLYSEVPLPAVTRKYIRLNSTHLNDCGLYTPPTTHNLTGLVVSQDCNLTYSNDQLAEYLANNRNAQTQLTARGIQGLTKAINNGISGILVGDALAGTKGIGTGSFSGITGVLNSGIDWLASQYNFNLTKDNMAAAPDQIKNANGEILFNMVYDNLGVYVEIECGIPQEIEREAERMNLFGFKYNRLGNIKQFDNIRKYFNFVQGVIETVMYKDIDNQIKAVPNIVLNKFKDIFNKGVRFWNYAGGKFLDYSKENYELYLDGVNNE